jgi:hypothetical protein
MTTATIMKSVSTVGTDWRGRVCLRGTGEREEGLRYVGAACTLDRVGGAVRVDVS